MATLLAIIAAFLVFINSFVDQIIGPKFYSPCVPAIRYKLGAVDKRFNFTQQKILSNIKQAEDIWEGAYGRDVFTYDPNGVPHEEDWRATTSARVITINMVYDDRQRLNTQVKQLEGKIIDENKKVEASIAEYKVKVASFNQRSEDLSQRIKDLDIKDPNYNQKFDEVYKESQELNKEAEALNQLARDLNQSADSYNSEVAKLNGTISRFNAALAQSPEEGVYLGETDIIEIYITNSNAELIHTLAHEFGHSLGIEHINNTQAIMFPYTTQTVKPTSGDIAAIQEACRERERR